MHALMCLLCEPLISDRVSLYVKHSGAQVQANVCISARAFALKQWNLDIIVTRLMQTQIL